MRFASLRSAKAGVISRGKKETPFLSDGSDAVSETFNPPPPSNWGLPDDGRVYSYPSFPRLKKAYFGNVRPPRQLLRGPEQQRTVDGERYALTVSKMMERGDGRMVYDVVSRAWCTARTVA